MKTRKLLYITKKLLSIEEHNFITEIRSIEERDLHGHALIQEVLNTWGKHVTKVAKTDTGEKTVVCGRSTSGGMKNLKVRLNKGERCTKDFDIMETANYGRSIVRCVEK